MKLVMFFLCFNVLQLVQAQNKLDEKGKKQGDWVKTYPNSKSIEFKGQFKDDQPYGEFIYFFQTGKIKARTNFIQNSAISYSVLFHENEVVLAEGKFIGKEKDSTWSFYGNRGHLGLVENYKKGKLHGKRTVFYVPENLRDTTKRISQVASYTNGELDGDFIEYCLANPKIISHSVQKSALSLGEGCLSVEIEHQGLVHRSARIKVRAFDILSNQEVEFRATGYLAVVLQHEIDHLNGVLFYDHINLSDPWKIEENTMIIES